MTRNSDFKRVVRGRMARTGESYAAARARLAAGGVLHVTNGDAAAGVLRAGGVTEPVLPWRDVLHLGPVPAVDDAELRRVRAGWLAERGWTTATVALADQSTRDHTLLNHRGEYLLWFEADLYDQLQLVQLLAMLHAAGTDPARITLVCVGEHPGIGHFGGLGELTPAQLTGLRGDGAVLTAAALDLAATAWATLRAPEPTGYADLVGTVSGELRFVPEAFDRLGREFPSTRDGLSLTERRILAALADGPLHPAEVFRRATAREVRPFLGDTGCFHLIAELAAGPRPLLMAATDDGRVGITFAGSGVLDGTEDRVALTGIDRWIGGVHLEGPQPQWRWDEGTERLRRS